MTRGKLCLILSAVVNGVTPMLAKIAYEGGTNAITLTFLRTALMIPLLFIMQMSDKRSFALSKKELISIIILGVVGGSFAMISMYASYEHISTGLATTLHFIYPLIVVIVSGFVYNEKITKIKLTAVMLVTIGIFLFVDLTSSADKTGVALALLSGIFYSFFVIYIDHSGLDNMDYIKLTFYLMIIMSIGTLVFGALTNSIHLSGMNGSAWAFASLISFLVTIVSVPMFQIGVRYEGASTAGIVSALEPITTIIIGAVFLSEAMAVVQYIGGSLLIFGVVLAEKYG